jgi:hypothetical protein
LRSSDPGRDLATRRKTEPVEHLLDVPFDRTLGQEETLGDLPVAQAEGNQFCHLLTTLRELACFVHGAAILQLPRTRTTRRLGRSW